MRNWRDADMSETVCYCCGVRKRDILRAITNGARTIEDVSAQTTAGTGLECMEKNPSGLCCHGDIQQILNIYATVHDSIQGGCGGACCGGDEA